MSRKVPKITSMDISPTLLPNIRFIQNSISFTPVTGR